MNKRGIEGTLAKAQLHALSLAKVRNLPRAGGGKSEMKAMARKGSRKERDKYRYLPTGLEGEKSSHRGATVRGDRGNCCLEKAAATQEKPRKEERERKWNRSPKSGKVRECAATSAEAGGGGKGEAGERASRGPSYERYGLDLFGGPNPERLLHSHEGRESSGKAGGGGE